MEYQLKPKRPEVTGLYMSPCLDVMTGSGPLKVCRSEIPKGTLGRLRPSDGLGKANPAKGFAGP